MKLKGVVQLKYFQSTEKVFSIFKTLLIQLKLSNQPQVKAKDFFCPLEVLKFVHGPKFCRAMRVYSAQFQNLI